MNKNVKKNEPPSLTALRTKKPEKKSHTCPIFRSLECWIKLSVESDEVKLSLVFESVKESEDGDPLHEQPDKHLMFTILTEPRNSFTNEEQINVWAQELYGVFTRDLTSALMNAMLFELKSAARVRLNMVGVEGHSNQQILDEQLRVYREYTQRALVMRGVNNRSPFNRANLTLVLQHALCSIPKRTLARCNLGGLYLQVCLHVSEHPEQYPTDLVFNKPDALRKLCDNLGVNLKQLADSVRNGEI